MLAPGTRVQIFGLSSRPDLNGARGVVQSFDEAKGRHGVKLSDEAGQVMAIKPVNLVELKKPVAKKAAQEIGMAIAKDGWAKAHATSLARLDQHAL